MESSQKCYLPTLMQILNALSEYTKTDKKVCATLGNFDGVHLGHQALLKYLINRATPKKNTLVFSFTNHPSQIFSPTTPTPLLTNTKQKIQHLENLGIDTLLHVKFSLLFSQQTAREFIKEFHKSIGFDLLLLGFDARVGKRRSGTPELLSVIAKELGFTLHYFPEFLFEDHSISSSKIRALIENGNLKKANTLLSRPFSIQGKVIPGEQTGRTMGSPTLNLSLKEYPIPPFGVYAITSIIKGVKQVGVANIGLSPTLKNLSSPILEVHFLQQTSTTYDDEIEISLLHFFRYEIHFKTKELLQKQIQKDISKAKTFFSLTT